MAPVYFCAVLDATRLLSRLYIGSVPRSALDVQRAGFDTLVLCAAEIQPPDSALQGLRALRCPLRDDPTIRIPDGDWKAAVRTAEIVGQRLASGSKVLVTCAMGLNRSALVCALTLYVTSKRPGTECVRFIQKRRKGSFGNRQFVRAMSKLQ